MVIIAALVLAAFSMLSTQNVKADSTSEARVLTYTSYVAPSNTVLASESGDYIVVGEVENVGSNIIANVTIQGIAFGSDGGELATTTTQAFAYYMLPGQKAPFYLDFNAASSSTDNLSWVSSVSQVSVSVSSVTDTSNTTTRQYSDLIIPAESPYIPGNDTYYVIGTIVNNGTQAAQDPWVVTTFYNSARQVVGLNFTDMLTSSDPAGGAYRFFASPADDTPTLTSEITNYTSVVDSLTLITSNSPLTTPSPAGSSTTSTTTASTSELTTLLIVVAVVVVIVVVLAVLMLLRKRQKTLPPPPPPTSPPATPPTTPPTP
jgi:flagellar basal body-associated protein FliL